MSSNHSIIHTNSWLLNKNEIILNDTSAQMEKCTSYWVSGGHGKKIIYVKILINKN